VKYLNLVTRMISSNIFSVFLSLVIAAVTQISSGLPELTNGINTREAGYSQSTTTSAMSAQPPVATSTMSIELETSSLPKQENVSNVETKSNSIGLPDTTTLLRTFYVLLAVTAIIIVYFVVRTVRLVRFRSCLG